MSERPERSEYGTAILAGLRIPVEDPVPESNLARFQPKMTFGDNNKDSDDLLSVWIQSSWLGGGQAFKVNAESQSERWWDSTLDTEFSSMLALRRKTSIIQPPSGITGTFYPLGDYGGNFYGSWDGDLCIFDTDTVTWSDTALNLGASPVELGTVFDDVMYIPLGANGFVAFDAVGDTVTAVQDDELADIDVKSAVVWDNKLCVLTVGGHYRTYNGANWTEVDDNLRIRDGSSARKLVIFADQSGDPTVYVVGSRGLWGVDPVNEVFVKTGAYWPPHPTQALAACVWRTTDLYINVGPGVHQWNRDTFLPMGLDRNDGLRAELRGYIVDLCPEYNGMTALVRGQQAESSNNVLFLDDPSYVDTSTTFPTNAAMSSVWRYNGYGWHKIWESLAPNTNSTWQCVGAAEDGSRYDLWWGHGGNCYRHPLRVNFHNPQQGVRVGIDSFEESGWLRTGRWNANMPLWPKLGSHIDVNLLPETSGVIQIEYMTDRTEPDWRSLGTASEPGRTRFYFGSNFVDGNGGEYDETTIGIPFDWIEFRYTFEGDAGNTLSTPLADSFVFKFIKIPLQTLSWSLNVPIMFDEQYYDVGPRELYERLRELASAEEFVPLVYKDETFRVLVAQTQADSFSGGNPHARFKLILLEVS